MKYLHTMVRVKNIDASLDFYCNKLGLKEVRRVENEKGRFTLIFLAAGNSMLFSINLYPGEFGCRLRSVFGSPTLC